MRDINVNRIRFLCYAFGIVAIIIASNTTLMALWPPDMVPHGPMVEHPRAQDRERDRDRDRNQGKDNRSKGPKDYGNV